MSNRAVIGWVQGGFGITWGFAGSVLRNVNADGPWIGMVLIGVAWGVIGIANLALARKDEE